ncbi:gibberellin 3-beta-dioxygenase 1-like [Phalaenopsis equestris]|uniref:gibberellin 3-beta-dioxygenase 1-like n=1 Tax=Phalaenopsis equestris TaxID=78828 RepID=UPI0009E5E099|nr:gibberellin 3-beta-dioxygenase 1-like [Phalaenopsis equestris]
MPSLSPPHYFDLSCVQGVPDSHCWTATEEHQVITDPANPADGLPVIDLADIDAAQRTCHALETLGAFQLTGHRIPGSVLDGLESQARRLFALPADEKLKAARSPGTISGYGLVPISSFFAKLMWSEGFTVSGPPRAHAAALWPHNPNPFCGAVEAYSESMRSLGQQIAGLILRALGLKEEDGRAITNQMDGVLQLNWYPSCPDPTRAVGMAAHTDSALITVLHQSNGSRGLQFLRTEESNPARWLPVTPLPGSLIVVAGDLLHVFSNGRFRSAVHRVMVTRAARFSAAYFCGPPKELSVGPDPKLVDLKRGPQFRAVTWAEYRGIKGKLFQGAIDEIRLSPSEAAGCGDDSI